MSRSTDLSRVHRPPRVAVIGVGNILLKDEGIGVHVIYALKRASLEGMDDSTIVDGGTCPDAFYLVPEGVDKLIVVDAVRGGCEPGTIYRFTPQDIVFRTGVIASLHQLGLSESLQMIGHSAHRPRQVVIVGVEPKEIAWGLKVSPELWRKIPVIIALI